MTENKVKYKVTINTGDVLNAGTNCEVFFSFVGEHGETEKIIPKQTSKMFERASSDVFDVITKDVGTLQKIIIGHNNKSGFFGNSGWFLNNVLVEREGASWNFACNQWFDDGKGDKKTVREILVQDTKGSSRTNYHISITTADEIGAGTDADVTICLFGEKGDTGTKILDTHNKNDFEKGSTDQFFFETDDVGPLRKIKLGLEGVNVVGSAWKCEKVVVEDPKRGSYNFKVDHWFEVKQWKEFNVENAKQGSMVTYTLRISTGNLRGAGTAARVFVQLNGDKDSTDRIYLENSPKNFTRGSLDTFSIETIELGDIHKITVGHDNSGFGADWFLQNITVKNELSGKEWHFGCGRWLSDSLDDHLVVRELSVTDHPATATTYEVSIKTGDLRGSGTDANVFLSINGPKLTTGRRKIDNSWNNFEAGKTDKFILETIDVGEVQSITVSHDNSGFGPAWFLDWVYVTNKTSGSCFKFFVGKWLAVDKDDGKIERTLEVADSKQSSVYVPPVTTYKVEVTTGDRPGASTSANVYITLFGNHGDSGKRTLDGPGNLFERNHTDTFHFNSLDLGDLQKILIGHDNRGFGSAWFLDKVVVTNQNSGQLWYFLSGKWFSKDLDDRVIEREIAAAKEDGEASAPLITYRVSVVTGDRRGAGTNANVFLTIVGSIGSSGERRLEKPGNIFERNKTDVFGFECIYLGDIQKISIRHDNSGFHPEWFLDKVIIESGKGEKWFFPCGQWLATGEGDGSIFRELTAVVDEVATYAPLVTYKIEILTGDRVGAGTDANVSIELFGENGKSGLRILENANNNFERNHTDVFGITAPDLGKLQHISIGHDNTGFSPAWFLNKVIVTSEKTQEQGFFLCGDWLKGPHNHRDISSSDKDGNSCFPLVSYKIQIKTGDRKGAGTDAKVFIILYGTNGETSKHFLEGPGNNFERNKKDTFGFKNMHLGEIQKILIGHDNSGFFPGWFLEKVVVTQLETDQSWHFYCGRWLASSEEDGATEREIPVSVDDGRESPPCIQYKISITTGDRRGAGTSANVFFTLFGTAGNSGERRVDSSLKFERNTTDVFGFEEVDLGDLQRLFIRHDDSGLGPAWFLDRVVVQSGKGERWIFPCGKWLAKDEEDGQIGRDLHATKNEPSATYLPLVNYHVEVYTGDRPGAGTNSQVSIEIYGENGKSGVRLLDNKRNCFERNKVDIFGIESVDLGKLFKIRIGHDDSGIASAWFLQKVLITSQKTNEKTYFWCNDWLEKPNTYREISACDKDSNVALPLVVYKIRVVTGNRRGAGTDARVHIVLHGTNGDSGVRILDDRGNIFERNKTDIFTISAIDLGELQKILIGHDNSGFGPAWFLEKVTVTDERSRRTWYFFCGKWLSKDEEDGAIEREIAAMNEDSVASVPLVSYKISVVTGDRKGAGTNANVYLTLFGTAGNSGERCLQNSDNNFERNKTDIFGIDCVDLGELERIIIRHDNSGFGSAWFLDKIVVESGKGERYYFLCGQWLSKDEGDGQISRELGSSKEDHSTYAPLVTYLVEVVTGDRHGAGTNARVSIELFGEQGRSGTRVLDNAHDNFERNKTDVFAIETGDLGKILKINISHDNSGIAPSWFLEKISIINQKTKDKFYFPCASWLKDTKNHLEIDATDQDPPLSQPDTTERHHESDQIQHNSDPNTQVPQKIPDEVFQPPPPFVQPPPPFAVPPPQQSYEPAPTPSSFWSLSRSPVESELVYGHQNDAAGRIYCAVAHTEWGNIPGKAKGNTCWFGYNNKERETSNFSWLAVKGQHLVKHTQGTPPNAIPSGHQNDSAGTVYSAIAHTQWGDIPGKAKGNTCWYSYGGVEYNTNTFSWVCSNSGESSQWMVRKEHNGPGQLVKGFQTDGYGEIFCAVAHTQWGNIPGKAKGNDCWYGYGGREYHTNYFSWLYVGKSNLVCQPNRPDNAIPCGNQTDGTGTLYAGIAFTQWGDIPAKIHNNTDCWFAYGGGEHRAYRFSWVCH